MTSWQFVAMAALLFVRVSVPAAEITNTVALVKGDAIMFTVDSTARLEVSSRVEILVDVPDVDLAVVGTARVSAIEGNIALAKIETATGKIAAGQRVRIAVPAPPAPRRVTSSDQERIQGRWRIIATLLDGQPSDKEVGAEAIFDGGKLTFVYPGPDGGTRAQEATFTLDPTKNPKHLDWSPLVAESRDEVDMQVYSLESDLLRMGTNRDQRTRPDSLADAKHQIKMVRIQPKPPGIPAGAAAQDIEAFRKKLKAARQGDVDSQYEVAQMYRLGNGVVQDKAEAVWWYRKAADQGHAEAQSDLGVMYSTGEGVWSHATESLRLHQTAAKKGVAQSTCAMGMLYESGRGLTQDYAEAIRRYRKAADQGYALAQMRLGHLYRVGRGVRRDSEQANDLYGKAKDFYREAAANGDLFAQNILGMTFLKGWGTPKDYNMAIAWFRVAAKRGHADAQMYLGMMHENGWGTAVSRDEAISWYRKASSNGSQQARKRLSEMGVRP